jgi:hypothetical protein
MRVSFLCRGPQGKQYAGNAEVSEDRGTFIAHCPELGTSDPCSSVVHWKPIRAALQSLLKKHECSLVTYRIG